MEEKAPAQGLGGMGICREKYWDERTDSEKIVVLADVAENLSRVVLEQAQQIDLLRLHRHAADGSLTAPLDAVAPREPRFDSFRYRSHDANPLRREPKR